MKTMYDYTFVSELEGGVVRKTTYQSLIVKLGIDKEEYMGAPLTEGGTPQALFVADLVKKAMPSIKKLTVLFEGSAILAV